MRNLSAVSPNGNRRARGVGVGAKLIFAVLEFWLFDFNDNVFNSWAVFVKNNNVRGFYLAAEMDGVLKFNPLLGVAVFFQQFHRVKLTNNFLWLQNDFFIANSANNIGFAAFDGYFLLKFANELLVKKREAVV